MLDHRGAMAANPTRGLYGREAELALIRRELEAVSAGSDTLIVVEGAAGMGKSRLLAEAATVARSLGIRVGRSAPDTKESMAELSALLEALFDGHDPLLDPGALKDLHAQPEQRFWTLRDLQQLIERAAIDSPLMISIDDGQWADVGSICALRCLPVLLRGLPIAWVIALRPGREAAPLVEALSQLRQEKAHTLVLGPLTERAVVDVAADMLSAEPGHSVLEQLAEADGSPFLVVETLLGLQEEDQIRVVDGRAELIDGRLPRRVQEKMRQRLGRLSDAANEAVMVAASLGRAFTFDELARTLGRPPSDLLGPVEELLEANLLVERGETLTFWHDITREAVRASVPVTARRALDRQAAGALLEGGALPVEVAAQLAASAEFGDELAITMLLDAAKVSIVNDPSSSATFGRRALEIAPSHHPQHGDIVATTAIALHIAGDSEQAVAFADQALREKLPTLDEADVRLSIAGMFAISPEIRISAGQRALALPDLPEMLRARHLSSLSHNLVIAGHIDEARTVLAETRAAVESSEDPRTAFTLHVADSALEYIDGCFGSSLELITTAYYQGDSAGDDTRLRLAHMWVGELLSTHDRYEEALAIAAEGLANAQRDRQAWAFQMFETWHGRMLMRTGRLAEAQSVLDSRFALEDGTHAASVLDAAGIVALGRLAVHTGDGNLVRRLTNIAQVVLKHPTPAVRRHAAWLLATFAMADCDVVSARTWLRATADPESRTVLPRFPMDVTDEIVLMRIALAADDEELARLALSNSTERAKLNPGIATVAASAAHVSGLVNRSALDLRQAAELFAQVPRPLEQASALEDLGAHLAGTDRDRAIDALGQALELYTQLGTSWDARRVRGRLRALGVRRRLQVAEPEAHGWAALTTAETAVARLVADGLTNREVAERLFVSPHTVNSHLRHVFTKLGINSRVQLARHVSDYEMA
jgi:DNA-binding CsgD family transcriptional regulator